MENEMLCPHRYGIVIRLVFAKNLLLQSRNPLLDHVNWIHD